MDNKNSTITMMIIIAYIVTFLFGPGLVPVLLYATMLMGFIAFIISAYDLYKNGKNLDKHVVVNTVIGGLYVIYIGIILFIVFT